MRNNTARGPNRRKRAKGAGCAATALGWKEERQRERWGVLEASPREVSPLSRTMEIVGGGGPQVAF